MAVFFSDESTALARDVNSGEDNYKIAPQTSKDILKTYEINKCVDWIRSNGFEKVCLQFPDHLLGDSTEVAALLQDILKQTVYILGDTTYESCCIDYVAAAHVQADSVIHFGPVCFSEQVGTIPHLYVYEKLSLDISKVYDHLFGSTVHDIVNLILDTGYYHLKDELADKLAPLGVNILRISDGRLLQNSVVYFIGSERKLANINFIFKPKCLYYFVNSNYGIIQSEDSVKILKKRYYLIEQIKDSQTFGIVIGTLAVNNFYMVIKRLKTLLDLYKKKYYIISVGKATVAKLANFPEIDIYVLVTCSMNDLYKSRDFYRPIATPYDVEVALNASASDIQFSLDFNTYLAKDNLDNVKKVANETDVSLVTGKMRTLKCEEEEEEERDGCDNKVAIKDSGALVSSSTYGVGYLNSRSWKGLEQNLGQTPVVKAEEGRTGIAESYTDEGR